MLEDVWPYWTFFSTYWALFSSVWGYLGPIWGYVGPMWGYVGPMWAYLRLMLGLCWAYLDPFLAYVGPDQEFWPLLKNMQKTQDSRAKMPSPKLKLISYCARFTQAHKKRLDTFGAGGFWKSQISQFWSYRRRKVPRVPQPSRTVSPKPKSCRILTLQSATLSGMQLFWCEVLPCGSKVPSHQVSSPFFSLSTLCHLCPLSSCMVLFFSCSASFSFLILAPYTIGVVLLKHTTCCSETWSCHASLLRRHHFGLHERGILWSKVWFSSSISSLRQGKHRKYSRLLFDMFFDSSLGSRFD